MWQPSALGGNLTMWFPFLHPSRKTFLSPLLGDSTETRAYWFVLEIAWVFPIHTSRVGIRQSTLLKKLTLSSPHVRDNLENKSMLVHSKKAFPLIILISWLHGTKKQVYCFLLVRGRVNFFSKWAARYSKKHFSCLNSYSSILNMISTPVGFTLWHFVRLLLKLNCSYKKFVVFRFFY